MAVAAVLPVIREPASAEAHLGRSTGPSRRDDSVDHHPARVALLLTVALIAGHLVWSMAAAPALLHIHNWFVAGDVWVPLVPAHYVANGAFPFLYEQNRWINLPGLPLLLAPVAFVGERLQLSESTPFLIPHPSMWPLVAPYGIATAYFALRALRSLATTLGVRARQASLQVGIVAGGLVPVVLYGHYEDIVAIAFLALFLRLLTRRRLLPAALALGGAILFKQWAFLCLPLLTLQTPAEQRARVLAYSAAPWAPLLALCALLDWRHVSDALLVTQTFPRGAHHQLWVTASGPILDGTPFRAGAFVVAIVVAWWLRDERDPAVVVAGVAAIFTLRLLFEPVVWAYYVGPAACFAAVAEAGRGGRWQRCVLAALLLDIWFLVHPAPVLWWAGAAVAAGLAFAGPLRVVWRRDAVLDRGPATAELVASTT